MPDFTVQVEVRAVVEVTVQADKLETAAKVPIEWDSFLKDKVQLADGIKRTIGVFAAWEVPRNFED